MLHLHETCKTVCHSAHWTVVLATVRLIVAALDAYLKMEINQDEAEGCNSRTDISNTCVSHFSYFAYNLRNSIPVCKYLTETDPLPSLQYFNSIHGQTWLLTWLGSCLVSIKRTTLVRIIWADVTLQPFQQKDKQTLLHMKTPLLSIQWSLVWMQTQISWAILHMINSDFPLPICFYCLTCSTTA